MCKDPTPTEHFWLMQMLGNFEAKYSYFIFSVPLFCPKIIPAPLKGAEIYRHYKQIQ